MIWQVLNLLVGLLSVRGEVGHNETDDSKDLILCPFYLLMASYNLDFISPQYPVSLLPYTFFLIYMQ